MAHVAASPREAREIRHLRIRKNLSGSTARPRLAVFRSLSNISAQVIDDSTGRTIASASSLEAEVKAQALKKKKTDVAKIVGALVADRTKQAGIETVVFDRGGYQYHGRVQALADAARERGLRF